MFKRITVFTIRIVYKSGYIHDFEVTEFNHSGGKYTWESYDHHNKPVQLGADDVAAVWQVGYRKVWK